MSPDAAQRSLRDPIHHGCIKHPTDHSTSCTSYWNSASTENPGEETFIHIPCSFHSYPLTHSVFHVLHKSPFKIDKRKNHLNPKFIVSDLCSVLISEGDQLGIQGWIPEILWVSRERLDFMSKNMVSHSMNLSAMITPFHKCTKTFTVGFVYKMSCLETASVSALLTVCGPKPEQSGTA
jgi:hypothetical protein